MNENYLDFETMDRFDLVIMIMCDFCALSPGQRAIMLKKFRSILKPGGAILLDVYSLGAFAQREETASYELDQLLGFLSPDKYWGFLNTFKYEEEKVMLDKYTIIEEARTRTVYNWLQYFDRESLTEEFVAAGLKVDTFFSDVAGTPFDPASGIRPDYKIEVREDVLREIDGPMLQHGLQGMHGQVLITPRNIDLEPDKVLLEKRYQLFRRAV